MKKNEINVISKNINEDIERFIKHCDVIIDKHIGLKIYLKDGSILKFCDEENICNICDYVYFYDLYFDLLPIVKNLLIKDYERLKNEMLCNMLDQKDKEIERLNNIIDELEKKFIEDIKKVKAYNLKHPDFRLINLPSDYLIELRILKEGKK